MTFREQEIYNKYLITSRSVKNKPWRARRNFDNLDEGQQMICKRISDRLYKYPYINIDDFFFAPYYNNKEAHYKLDFFASPKAMSAYTQYMKHLDSLPPDDIESLRRIAKSLKFLRDYLNNNGLTVEEYFNSKEENQYTCLIHLKERKTWTYALISFPEFNKTLLKCDKDITKLMYGNDFFDKIDFARAKTLVSDKYKKTIKQMKNKLKIEQI